MAKPTITDSEQETKAPEKEQPEDLDETAGGEADDSQPESDEGSEKLDDKDSEESEESGDEEQPSEEDELKDWAEKKGLPLDDPIKLAKSLREAEKKLTASGQEAAKLRKQSQETVEESLGDEAGTDDVKTAKLLNALAVTDFYLNNPEARQHDDKMAEVLKEKPHLQGDFETLLALAKSRTSTEELAKARKQGEKDALKKANQSGRQGAPAANAKKRGRSDTQEDPFLKGFDQD